MNANQFAIRMVDNDGLEWFYTGRAGKNWLSRDKHDAHIYETIEAARSRATKFNAYTTIHGLHSIAIRAEWMFLNVA